MSFIRFRVLIAAALASVCSTSMATAAQMYMLRNVVVFNGTNGQDPYSGLVSDSAGNLYGTTALGGVNGQGSVFEIAFGTHAMTTLVSFNGTNGLGPKGTLVADSSGNLYGTTSEGNGSDGTIYEMAAGTHAFSVLATFGVSGPNSGTSIAPLIVDSLGNLYGTASAGGSVGYGTVFELAAGSHSISNLISFNNANINGTFPFGGLVADASGNLYGTTDQGGANGEGNVFKVAAGTHVLSNLFSFDGSNGAFPYGSLISDASGNLYGTTDAGGLGYGTVFKFNPTTDAFTTLFSFHGTDGSEPRSSLIFDAKGNLYGTTYEGGATGVDGFGTVFELNPTTGNLTDLVSFGLTTTSPDNPLGSLIFDASGNLYGTSQSGGGILGDGTVFELSPVPEPSSLVLSLLAIGGLALTIGANKRRRASAFHG